MASYTFSIEQMPSPVGTLLIVTDDQDFVRALHWEDHATRMHRALRLHYGPDKVALTERRKASNARKSLEAYFAGDIEAIDDIAVKTGGTDFQRDVWAALRRIPAGQTLSYGALAAKLDRPKAVRAVGLANGANPVGIIVPCHRVIGSDASLTGYGGGIERKRWLLNHEGVDCAG